VLPFTILGLLPHSQRGNGYFVTAMDCVIKWLDVYAISNEETSMEADVMMTSFYRFGVASDQGRKFESQILQ
jgi:hypothetical protein